MAVLVGLPFAGGMIVGIVPGLQLLVLLPWAWLVTPPALVFGRPLFNWTEMGYQPQSGWALVAMLGFWIALSLLLALVSAWLMRNSPEPVAAEPAPQPEPEKRPHPPAAEVVVCPACRATNVPSPTCFRCGASLS